MTVIRFDGFGKRPVQQQVSLFQLMRVDEQRTRILKLIDQRMNVNLLALLTGWSTEQINRLVAERNQTPPEAA